MSVQLFKKVDYPLSKLLDDIHVGEIGLPDIQRPFVWERRKARELFDSMYKGFPVGYLLFWENDLSAEQRQIGTGAKQKAPYLLIVDGQQRLTCLYAVLKRVPIVTRQLQDEHLRIAFRPKDETFEVTSAAHRLDPEYIGDISDIWMFEDGYHNFVSHFLTRLRASRDVSDAEENLIRERIDRLRNLENYPFTALELANSVNESQVADIFVRINSQGVRLNQADFILTLMSVFWDEGRKELEQYCREAKKPPSGVPSPSSYFIKPEPDQLLRVSVAVAFRRARLQHVYSLLRGKDLETGEFREEHREKQFELLKTAQAYVLDVQNWADFAQVLLKAGYRQEWMITSRLGMLFTYALFLIGKRDYQVAPQKLREVTARWLFMTALTSRYTSSGETLMEEDLARFRGITAADEFVAVLDDIVRATLHDDFWNITIPGQLESATARSPVEYAYYAALTLLDARVLFSDMKLADLLTPGIAAKKSVLERHHLFPRAYLSTIGFTTLRDTDQLANYALVEWRDNIRISDASPADYFPEYASQFDEETLAMMYYWHALPNEWYLMDYPTFLESRRQMMARVIRAGFAKLCGETSGIDIS